MCMGALRMVIIVITQLVYRNTIINKVITKLCAWIPCYFQQSLCLCKKTRKYALRTNRLIDWSGSTILQCECRVLTPLRASWFVMAHVTLLPKASITRWTEFWPPFVLHGLLWLTLPSYQRPLSLGGQSSDHPSCFMVCYGSRYPPTKGLYH